PKTTFAPLIATFVNAPPRRPGRGSEAYVRRSKLLPITLNELPLRSNRPLFVYLSVFCSTAAATEGLIAFYSPKLAKLFSFYISDTDQCFRSILKKNKCQR